MAADEAATAGDQRLAPVPGAHAADDTRSLAPRRPISYGERVTDWLVPLADVRFSDEEVQAVAAVYRSGWLSQGPRVAEFERAFASFAGVDPRRRSRCPAGPPRSSSAACWRGLGAGDEVVLPSLTFAATAAAVVRCGRAARVRRHRGRRPPVAVGGVGAGRAERAHAGDRHRRLRAVIPARRSRCASWPTPRGLTLIEDAAHAVGALERRATRRHDRAPRERSASSPTRTCRSARAGCWWPPIRRWAARARRLRSHGLSAGTWERHRGLELDYDVLEPGFNLRLDEPRAALGTRLLARLAGDTARRGRAGRRLRATACGRWAAP